MNKIIWKDIESTDIKGLMICELPPITKPKMRVQETAIDGVDGSIIEELGYESYDKTIKIGLTKGFDIDEVIEYFTGEGNVVFSNEQERYYKARIIEQIDFERLLKFRTATVKFRVQPFKYEYEEKTQKTKIGSAEGIGIKITDVKATEIKIEGRSTQDGEPTPDAPVEIESVGTYIEETGKYEIEIKVTNGTEKNTKVLVLNEPLRSLPNGVKDIAYIKNNKLYVDRYVGSVILDGSENWLRNANDTNYYRLVLTVDDVALSENNSTDIKVMSDYFIGSSAVDTIITTPTKNMIAVVSNNRFMVNLVDTDLFGVDAFKTWLSQNNVQVDYELATPITEELGDITILELLDGENNISNSENTNMVVDYVDNKMIINNFGNYTSKPIFEIEGAGTIKFILNGYAVFNYTFDNDGKVVIDSEKQDAYLGNVLKNRNMTGEFPILNKGKNIITWEGLIKNIEVSLKSRWI